MALDQAALSELLDALRALGDKLAAANAAAQMAFSLLGAGLPIGTQGVSEPSRALSAGRVEQPVHALALVGA